MLSRIKLADTEQPLFKNEMQKVVITGLGAITPIGLGARYSWNELLRGASGVVSVASRGPHFQALPSTVAGVVPTGLKTEGRWDADEWLSPADQRRMAKFTQFAMAASQQALEDADWNPRSEDEQNMTGVVLGTGIGNLETMYNTSLQFQSRYLPTTESNDPISTLRTRSDAYRRLSPHFVPLVIPNLAAGHVSIRYQLRGPVLTPSSACTTGLHALISAAHILRSGSASVMLAGGSESCIHPLALAGFARLKSLATAHNSQPDQASRPFDTQRSGFVLAEGAAVLVLETEEHALARGANIYAELAGWAETGDAWHVTSPAEGGIGAERSIRGALRSAGRVVEEVDYVNAHATGTGLGDYAEGLAIARVFGNEDRSEPIVVGSCKGNVGHLVGAAGAVEALWTALAVKDGRVPATKNLDILAGGLGRKGIEYVKGPAIRKNVEVAVTNSFGFGGTNASICITKYQSRNQI
ncbi:MAG: Mitochondrial beta-keto-acyl synthase [Vezdaea aestivalis]|nr:MAG: Mitochondrial beta-keto-acyl synthase [Vezdaea aestivalis]